MKTDYLPGTEFTLVQQDDMYHFNSDTVLLGRFMKAKQKDSVLDIGCASGALLLYASLHHPRQITGIDLFDEVLEQARENLERNHVRAGLVCTRVQDYRPAEQFDVIVCNPPYFAPWVSRIALTIDRPRPVLVILREKERLDF